jgi:hypothetical protein
MMYVGIMMGAISIAVNVRSYGNGMSKSATPLSARVPAASLARHLTKGGECG